MRSVRLREGEATWGVWLPLALANVVKAIRGAWGEDKAKISDILSWFMLPALAEAMRSEEDRADNDRTVERFNELLKRYGGG